MNAAEKRETVFARRVSIHTHLKHTATVKLTIIVSTK